ncbi:butyrophilin subfamily 3 member A3-like isoform X5 [Cygnus olor]|uniref:butyrophilin subfamily 3 member A3-like isoform X5 n=1 Tax=Cygnus olor TaxID=8869 RepID=UPI001ADE1610|nr:butyrophilin subfamily 3 member A3-like isoform X5 [Cygnus olor]
MGLPWGCGHPSLTSHARGLLTLLVTLLLLRLGSAQLRVVGPDHPLTATVGQDVVLPCHLSPQRDARTLEVRWIRHRLSETVHHYRNGEDLYREQMGAYAGRTELARDGLSAGSLDLRITGLRPSDDGQYVCTVEDADDYDEAIVELEVSAPFFHNAQPWMVALALVLVLFALSVGLGVYLFRKKAAKKDAKLVKQAAEIEEKDARLDEQAAELEKQAAELAWRRFLLPHNRGRCALGCPLRCFSCPCWGMFRSQEVPHLVPRGAAPGPELGKACPGLSSAPDGLAPSVPAVKVTLDPDTAHPDVVVSKNNKSVRRESKRQQVPNTPKRFDNRCCVLGHEEFREGRHCWQVEGQEESLKYSRWGVGVARASVKRKGWIDMSPEEGIWAVQYIEGQLKSLTSPRTPLSLSPFPTRIWVCLDCTQGQVSFINADNGVEIFTFTAASFNGESIRPWFWLGMNAQLCLRDSTL